MRFIEVPDQHRHRSWLRGLAGLGGAQGVATAFAGEGRGAGDDRRARLPSWLDSTVLRALGINPDLELGTSAGRPIRLSEGAPVSALMLG